MRFELKYGDIVPPPYGWKEEQTEFRREDFPGAILLETVMVPVIDARDEENRDTTHACGISVKIEFWTDFIVIRDEVLPTTNGRIVPKVVEYDNGFEISWRDNANRRIDQPVSYFVPYDGDEDQLLEIYMNAEEQIHRDYGPAIVGRCNRRRCRNSYLYWYDKGVCYHFLVV